MEQMCEEKLTYTVYFNIFVALKKKRKQKEKKHIVNRTTEQAKIPC